VSVLEHWKTCQTEPIEVQTANQLNI